MLDLFAEFAREADEAVADTTDLASVPERAGDAATDAAGADRAVSASVAAAGNSDAPGDANPERPSRAASASAAARQAEPEQAPPADGTAGPSGAPGGPATVGGGETRSADADQASPAGAKVLSFGDHQVRRLQERNMQLATRMRELVGIARENEQLSAHLHRLSLALLGADRLDEVCGRVYATLREDVGVELAVIALYAPPKRKRDAGLDELRAPDDPVRVRFDHVFERNLPVCGPLSPEAARELVGLRGRDFCSAALVPIGVRPFGLLALLSRDPERYHASMGKVVLRRMSELLAVTLAGHLELPADS